MDKHGRQDYVLGLDIGTTSVGWAAVAMHGTQADGLLGTGVRIFEAGMEGDIGSGRGESRNAKRRQARLQRRQIDRRARRMKKLFHILQGSGLLPAGKQRDVLPVLDQQILSRYSANLPDSKKARDRLSHILPYWLRARALDHRLEPYELGRALYHLAQRRGFLSNRRAPERDDKEKSVVKGGISELQNLIDRAGARTLGEYFATLDPREERIRARYTSRAMYLDEFEQIWTAQQRYHAAVLTDGLKRGMHRAIFYQRPLSNQKDLIGYCQLEPSQRRAPWALLITQHFRILQRVNDTVLTLPDGQKRALTPEERAALLGELETTGSLSFGKVRKLLKLPRGTTLNWEEGGEKRFLGNSTNARLAKVFGDAWDGLTPEMQSQVVEDVRSFEKEDALVRRAVRVYALTEDAARELAALSLEEGHCRHSRKAIERLLPYLEKGVSYGSAIGKAYPERLLPSVPLDRLPAIQRSDMDIRNPVVNRVLGELHKVVNALVARYGRPSQVRIELARDLRRSKKSRQEATRRNRQNERGRQAAAQKITAELGIQNPRRADIEKVLLAQECDWTCPYTGKCISMASLFGSSPQFDIEHIVPFSRCLNNSYMNKTLCEVAENRNVKRNQTPFEAYGQDDARWNEIIERVKRFSGSAARAKLARFQTRDVADLDEMASNQLNDTRYASRLAIEYVGQLYGGPVDIDGVRRVQAAKGGTTAYLRDMWGLNMILGDGDLKTRDDHRHHAVDAVAIALTTPKAVKQISQAAADERRSGRIKFGAVKLPWARFLEDVREHVDAIKVSHAPSRKVRGPLHEETLYGAGPERDEDGKPVWFHVRKRLEALSPNEVRAIVDPHVRERVERRLAELGGTPAQAFGKPENHPFFVARDGRQTPIHKVRIRKKASAILVGGDHRRRHVLPGSNHHMEIIETTDRRGQPKWEGRLVSMIQATERLRRRQPVVDRCVKDGERFLFSLSPGDLIQIDGDDGERRLCVVRSVSRDLVEFVGATDARIKKDIRAAKDWGMKRVNGLRRLNPCKVQVTALGEVRSAND